MPTFVVKDAEGNLVYFVAESGTGAENDPLILASTASRIGARNESAAEDDTGTYSLIALTKRLLQKLTEAFPDPVASETTLAEVVTGLQATLTTAFTADATGQEQTVVATLSATAWVPLSPRLAIPDWATRVMITAPAGLTRYRLNGDPAGAPDGTPSAGVTMGATDTWIVALAEGTSRTFGLSTSVSAGLVRIVWLP
jgi:hypothetical protein